MKLVTGFILVLTISAGFSSFARTTVDGLMELSSVNGSENTVNSGSNQFGTTAGDGLTPESRAAAFVISVFGDTNVKPLPAAKARPAQANSEQ